MSHLSRARTGLVLSLLVSALLGNGCGSSGDGDGSNNDPDRTETVKPGETAKKMITAADGGELTLGGVTASIPPGALAEDTEITVEALDPDKQPDSDTIVADVLDFGPDGTEFLKPVTLEFEIGDLALEKNQKAMMAFLKDDKWVTLDDSKLAGGKVTATTTHFTPFTIVVVLNDDGTGTQTGGMCSTDAFDACGGDIKGTWEFTAACATLAPDDIFGGSDGENPFAMCDEKPSVAATVDLTGTVTFGDDSAFSVDQSISISAEISIPGTCIQGFIDAQGGGDATIEDVCTQFAEGTIKDGDCVVSLDQGSESQKGTGTWSTEGGALTITDDEDSPGDEPTSAKYCVKGDELTVVMEAGSGQAIRYTATRK